MNRPSRKEFATTKLALLICAGLVLTPVAQAASPGAQIKDSAITLSNNNANHINAGGGSSQALGFGKARNGILVANSVYLGGNGALGQTPVTVLANQARNVQAEGGRITANALALDGAGRVQDSSVLLAGNSADGVRSQGSEASLAGVGVHKALGNTLVNAVQILGRLLGGRVALFGNTAQDIAANQGLAAANSVVAEQSGRLGTTPVHISANESRTVRADSGKTALAASLHTDGQIANSAVTIAGNKAGATTGEHDALAVSVRNSSGASITSGSQIAVVGNRGSAQHGGTVNSLDNQRGQINAGTVTIAGNEGNSSAGGTVNSVTNRNRIQNSELTIANNRGQANRGGTVNSVENKGVVQSSRITIVGNSGKAEGGGLLNSVKNKGRMQGATVLITGNRGSSLGGGIVNSVDNKGLLTGQVVIAHNSGQSTGGGTINSLVNRGKMTGKVIIANNQGTTVAGSTSNSVINNGAISGKVSIMGNASGAGLGATTGIVRVNGKAAVAGADKLASAANGGRSSPGVINRSVIVGPMLNNVYH